MGHGGLVGLVIACVESGCAGFAFQEPSAQLVAVAVTGLGIEGGSLRLDLDVTNPNAYELRTVRIAVGVDLAGTHFGDADLPREVVLPARGTTRLEVPVRFTWSGVGAGARAMLGRGAVRYDLTGTLTLGTPLGDKRIGVRGAGDVTLRDLAR